MVVVDASAVVDGLVARPGKPSLKERLAREELGVPELLHLEVYQAIRALVRGLGISVTRADQLRRDYLRLPFDTFPHGPLLDRIWELRGPLTSYDASYVALAELLEVPLVTTDRRLARAKGHRARIELY